MGPGLEPRWWLIRGGSQKDKGTANAGHCISGNMEGNRESHAVSFSIVGSDSDRGA